MTELLENHELRMAKDFVEYTNSHIFLTGKAGTGKTTFLKNLKEHTAKRMVVTAPTGVAAINAGGVTLHSFFQLPFGPSIPGNDGFAQNKNQFFRFSKEKKQIIKTLDLLVIDEISMVRADVLDAVDKVLQRHRRNNKPFGGVQLLMIGDLHQLPPVAKKGEWDLLREYYESVYFFSSLALAEIELVTIELKQVYRQSDVRFINLLNRVRDNRLDGSLITELNQRYIEGFKPKEDQGYITLTTHNYSAEDINQNRLQGLEGKKYNLNADISGDFPEHIYPTFASLILKVGAQVMFLRNDVAPEKRYYNGKIGKISFVSDKEIIVSCPGESEEIAVKPVQWENIKYTINEENKEIEEDIIGKFKQFPLKLAWAITIHKGQGLTFEKAIIDANAAFAHGQVYVALSRCKTFEGMVLSAPISARSIELDQTVVRFIKAAVSNCPSQEKLNLSKINYQQKLLLDCFDFQSLNSCFNYLIKLLRWNANSFQVFGISDIDMLQQMFNEHIFVVSEKFKQQMRNSFSDKSFPESDPYVLERVSKAFVWFKDKFALILNDIVEKLNVETDSKELGKKMNNALNNLKQEIVVKFAGVNSCEDGFSSSSYLRFISNAEIEFAPGKKKKPKAPEYDESDIEHPELFKEIKEWRTLKAKEKNIAPFLVFQQQVLIQIVICLPDSKKALKRIKGVGKQTIKNYGEDILDMVVSYREKNDIGEVKLPELKIKKEKTIPQKKPVKKKVSVPNTKQTSFDMFNKGLAIDEIAKERGLVESTIQGHLCFYIKKGDLDINQFFTKEKQDKIEEKLSKSSDGSLKTIKIELGSEYSYGDIKLLMAHQAYLALKK